MSPSKLSPTKILIIILVTLLVLIYVRYYFSHNNDYDILQTDLENFNLNLLYDRYPVIIYDQILNPQDLLKTIFKYQFTFKKFGSFNPLFPTLNNHKFMVLYNDKTNATINIISPKYKSLMKWSNVNGMRITNTPLESIDNVQYITIKLKQNQVMILPMQWMLQSSSPLLTILLDDIPSKILSSFV